VKKQAVEKLKKHNAISKERDSGWMIMEMAKGKVEDSIE
jgi:hypothetical protein